LKGVEGVLCGLQRQPLSPLPTQTITMTEPKHYRQGYKDLDRAEKLADEVTRLGLLLGLRADGLNPANAQRAVSKAVEELLAAQQQAKENGYASLAFALKALGQKKQDLNLPEWAEVFPEHWAHGTETKRVQDGYKWKTYKVPAVTPLQAQKRLDKLKPTLATVLEELDWNPAEVAKVETAFKTKTYDVFVELLFNFLRGEGEGEEVETQETIISEQVTEEVDLDEEALIVLSTLS
jgi:hypothetical protein